MKIKLNITKKEIQIAVFLSLFAMAAYAALQCVLYFELQYEKSLLIRENLVLYNVRSDPFENLVLESQAFYVWDLRDKKMLACFNEEMQLPLASLTKLMTAAVAAEISSRGVMVTVDENAVNNEGNSGLFVGEKWRLSDIIDFMLMSSSNDGASAVASAAFASGIDTKNSGENDNLFIARKAFIAEMNKKAKQLKMVQSFFLNETGLDKTETVSGAYGSAKDMAILLEYILAEYPYLLEASAYKNLQINSDSVTHQVDNTNQVVEILPGVIASKTGWTDLAGGNLMVAFDMGIGHTVIVTVLGSTKEGRFEDVRQLIWASMENNF